MLFKARSKPNDLTLLMLLTHRIDLDSKDKYYCLNLKKGYEGEVKFDTFTEKLQCECLILNDLLLEVNNTTFQIDSLIIFQGKIYFYEVKNYEGDYYYESDKFYKKPKLEVVNPLHQLSRSESLLRQLLLSLGSNLPIDASVVFINSNFTLYQAPLDKPIIFPTQVDNYVNQLNAIPSKITDKHRKLAEKLMSLHITNSPYKQIPPYTYNQLRKGITCLKCYSFSLNVNKRNYVCKKCQHKELLAKAVLRNINDYKLLFPNEKVTTSIIHDWCQPLQSQKRIRNILLNNFNRIGANRWSYFE